MLRIIQNTSVSGAMNYFQTADYYSRGEELQGRWHGKAAAMLGLSGEVQKKDWDLLCQNRHPQTGATLTQRMKSTRRVGYDFNFRAPKSLSVLYGLTGDERIMNAFRDAVNATMTDMEAEMQTRIRKGGKEDADRTTGNFVYGEWIHMTGRPVNGVPDPHLHAHCFVFNTTWDDAEKKWKAGQFAGLKRDAPYWEAVYHSRLAENLANLGLEITRSKSGWEIAGVSKALRDKFSNRTSVIEKAAKDKRITDPTQKMELSAKTREKKNTELSLPELSAAWADRLTADETAALKAIVDRIGTGPAPRDPHAARNAADYAVGHLFERKAVVPLRMLLREALRQSVGHASVEATERAVLDKGLLVADSNGRRMASTLDVLGEEQKMIAFARNGRGTCRAFAPGEHLFKERQLNTQQRDAVRHVLHSTDRVMVVVGGAGVGKTTMMKELVSAVESSGTPVFAFAPSANASRGVLRSEGFDADTVARLLKDEKLQAKVKSSLLIIDEAGLLGSKTMKEVFDLAGKLDCRVLLSGDPRQHGPVERGDVLRLLQTQAGIVPAEIREIQRQSGKYKDAVKAISEGKLTKGFEILDQLQWVREIPDLEERDQALADEYTNCVTSGKTALVVAPTHAEGEHVAQAIRRTLRDKGWLRGAEHSVLSLRSKGLTDAQRADLVNYEVGDVLVYTQNAQGVVKGTRKIAGRDRVPVEQASRFEVFTPKQMHLAKGDRIRITKNGTTADGKHALNNGEMYQVKDFTRQGDIVLNNGWKIARDWGHITQGYVSTSHSSQGKTVQKVLIAQSAESFPASSLQQFYVSASRGKQSVTVFTDDRKALLEAVRQSEQRLTATDLLTVRHRQDRNVMLRHVAERNPTPSQRQRDTRALER